MKKEVRFRDYRKQLDCLIDGYSDLSIDDAITLFSDFVRQLSLAKTEVEQKKLIDPKIVINTGYNSSSDEGDFEIYLVGKEQLSDAEVKKLIDAENAAKKAKAEYNLKTKMQKAKDAAAKLTKLHKSHPELFSVIASNEKLTEEKLNELVSKKKVTK